MVITKMSFPSAAFNADGAAEQRNLWLRLHCSEDECDFGPLSLATFRRKNDVPFRGDFFPPHRDFLHDRT
jgi:hypothetical protein